MTLKVVGAGIGRTGTHSLKIALERLLGAPCYHMIELFKVPAHVPLWQDAADGRPVDWPAMMDGYAAAVDWPASACWEELAAVFPDAVILLSVRDTSEQWWTSASRTIFQGIEHAPPGMEEWHRMVRSLLASRWGGDPTDEESSKAAYERHNAHVRATADPSRLVEWRPQDGWGPLCRALGVPVPDEPFPVTNTTEEFRAQFLNQGRLAPPGSN